MTMIALVRHGAVDALGRYLAGRRPGELLNDEGHAQAAQLALAFRDVTIDAIVASPLERTWETARAIAGAHRAVKREDALLEVDFGEWTGKSFEELAHDERWSAFNRRRSAVPIPGGESLVQVQRRGVECVHRLATAWPNATVVAVSHADVIRATLAHFLRTSLDDLARFEVAPASTSLLEIVGDDARVICLNCPATESLARRR